MDKFERAERKRIKAAKVVSRKARIRDAEIHGTVSLAQAPNGDWYVVYRKTMKSQDLMAAPVALDSFAHRKVNYPSARREFARAKNGKGWKDAKYNGVAQCDCAPCRIWLSVKGGENKIPFIETAQQSRKMFFPERKID